MEHERTHGTPSSFQKAIIEQADYGRLASYAGITFCPCNRQCTTNHTAESPDQQLALLIREIQDNQFADVLVTREGNDLVSIAAQKALESSNTGRMNPAEVLSVLLYTGSRLQHPLRMSMLKPDSCVIAWPVLSKALHRAILKQGVSDSQMYLYHGLHGVSLDYLYDLIDPDTYTTAFSFGTFVSTSRNREVAMAFATGEGGTYTGPRKKVGLLLQFVCQEHHLPSCTDVAWLSKFPYEEEVVIAPWQLFQPAYRGMSGVHGGPAAPRSIQSLEDARRALNAIVKQERVGSCTVHVWNVSLRPMVCAATYAPPSVVLPPVVPPPAVPPPVEFEPLYYLGVEQRHAIAGNSRLHVLNEFDLPAWVPLKLISRALFGDQGVNTVECCTQRWGDFRFATEFANVHTTWTFTEAPIEVDGERYSSSEHYFQAMKFEGNAEAKDRVMTAPTPSDAWSRARRYTVRDDWESIDEFGVMLKSHVMMKAVHAKFSQHVALRELLLSTNEYPLLHVTHDPYWGTGVDAKGHNMLGQILMTVRTTLANWPS